MSATGAISQREFGILDCGAYTGMSALYFHSAFPRSKIIAVEPDSRNFEMLVSNTESTDIVALNAAVGGEHGSIVRMDDPGMGAWGSRTEFHSSETPASSRDVSVWSLEKLYERYLSHCPLFMVKVDIEGSELGLFQQDSEILSRAAVVVVELHDWMLPEARTSRTFVKWVDRNERLLVVRNEHCWAIDRTLLLEQLGR